MTLSCPEAQYRCYSIADSAAAVGWLVDSVTGNPLDTLRVAMFPEIVNRNEVKGGFSQESFEGTAEGPSLRNVGKNVAMLTISHVGCRLLYLMLFAMVGRLHGVRALGGYAVATACAALVLVLTDLGVSERIVREMAPRRETGSIEYARALGFKLIAALAVWVLFVLISRWLPFEPALVQLCGLMVAGSLIETFSHLNNAVCRAHEHMELEALGSGAQAITFVGFGVLFLSWNLGLVWLGFAAIAGALVELVLTTAFARRFVRLGVRWRSSWATLRSAGPYGITSLTVLVVPHIDVLLLALVVTQTEVGEFASVSRLLHGGAYLPLIATSAMLPTATIMWVRYGAIGFGRIISDAVKVSLALGALSFAVLFVASGPIMNGLYGEDIARLQPLMKLGAAFMLLKFPVACLSVALTASGRQTARALSVLTGLAITCILIIALPGRFGVQGALGALIIGEMVVLWWQAMATRDLWLGSRRFRAP